jgi:hypothetical protein
MATYYGTYGQKVQYLASDPSDPQIGQVWYNSTSATLKVRQLTTVNAWATGGAIPTATDNAGAAGSGTQNASLYFGGGTGPTYLTTSQSYNGTSWTATPSMTIAKGLQGSAGTQTAAIGFAGYSNDPGPSGPFGSWITTESWNGSTWTTGGNVNQNRYSGTGIGLQTAALYAGGFLSGSSAPTGSRTDVESYNGTSWTSVSALSQRRQGLTSSGTQTAALAIVGWISPNNVTAVTESWNGSSWTSGTSANTARYALGGCGTQTAALAFGGSPYPPVSGVTESWNGVAWTTLNPLATARQGLSGSGTNSSALAIGGYNGTARVTATEEWNTTLLANNTVTVS